MNGRIECALIATVCGEIKSGTSASGTAWLSFSGRVGTGDDADWPRIAIFGELAQGLTGRIEKGVRIYVEGTIKLNEWKGADGAARAGLSISAKRVELVGAIGRRAVNQAKVEAKAGAPEKAERREKEPEFSDDLPF